MTTVRRWQPEPKPESYRTRWLDNMSTGSLRGRAANPSGRTATLASSSAETVVETGVVPEWMSEEKVVTGPVTTWALAYFPIAMSVDVKLNGVGQTYEVDYTVSGNVVTFSSPSVLFEGISGSWVLTVEYQYYVLAAEGDLGIPYITETFTVNGLAFYALNQTAFTFAGNYPGSIGVEYLGPSDHIDQYRITKFSGTGDVNCGFHFGQSNVAGGPIYHQMFGDYFRSWEPPFTTHDKNVSTIFHQIPRIYGVAGMRSDNNSLPVLPWQTWVAPERYYLTSLPDPAYPVVVKLNGAVITEPDCWVIYTSGEIVLNPLLAQYSGDVVTARYVAVIP